MSYFFHSEARAEHLASVAFYERQRPGLGRAYLSAFEAVIARIMQTPQAYRIERPPDIRRASLSRFPFSVLFRDTSAGTQILAVAHDRRQPLYWIDRR